MRNWIRFLGVYALFISTAPASAQQANDIGTRISGVLTDLYGPLFLTIAGVSYLVGFIMLVKGLDLLKDNAAGGGMTRSTKENGAGRGLAHLASGTVLIAFPEMIGIGVSTLFGSSGNIFGSASEFQQVASQLDMGNSPNFQARDGSLRQLLAIGTITAPENCYGSAAPAVCFSKNLAKNVVPIGLIMTYAGVFLAGALMVAKAIFEFAHEDVGGRGGDGKSAIAKAAVGFLMCNSPFLIGSISTTIMGQAGALTTRGGLDQSFLSYRFNGGGGGNTAAWLAQHQEMMGYLFTILALFGALAFFRGVFVLKAVTDRRGSNASAGNAIVFMVAGVLLANMKSTACYVTTTFGGSGMTMGFCQ